jgi:ABC-2 type transport system permease protein
MFWQIVNTEHTKIFKRAIFWVEVAVALALIAAMYLVMFAISRPGASSEMPPEAIAEIEEILTWPSALNGLVGMAAGPSLGGIIMVILAGAVMAQEYTWNTLQLWLSRGVPRSLFLGAKFVALLLPMLILVLAVLVAGGALTATFTVLIDGSLPVSEVAWLELLLQSGKVAYTMLPYAALAFFLAVLSRSTIVAVGGGLAYVLAGEGVAVQLLTLAGGGWAQIGRYIPSGLAQALQESNAGLVIGDADSLDALQYLEPGQAAIGIALYTLLFVGLAVLAFRRQDYTG